MNRTLALSLLAFGACRAVSLGGEGAGEGGDTGASSSPQASDADAVRSNPDTLWAAFAGTKNDGGVVGLANMSDAADVAQVDQGMRDAETVGRGLRDGSGVDRVTKAGPPMLRLLAGSLGGSGNQDGIGAGARFARPYAVATDNAGNLFVADSDNHTLRKVVIATGAVTTLAGAAGVYGRSDGIGAAARFSGPGGVACDSAGNLFVADTGNNTIRRVVIATGQVTTLAGSADSSGAVDAIGAAARFSVPWGIVCDGAGNLFVGDLDNHAIRKVVIATGAVTTLAGSAGISGAADGTGAAARFYNPWGVAFDGAGNLLVADAGNYTIRKVVIATGAVTTLAGSVGNSGSSDGTGTAARFGFPESVVSDGAGSLFVADIESATIRRVVIASGAVTTLAGSANNRGTADGIGTAARFGSPGGVASDGAGNLFVGDTYNDTIRKVVIATGEVSTLAGSPLSQDGTDGVGAAARFSAPSGMASDGAGSLFVADTGNNTIRRLDLATAAVTTLAGAAAEEGKADGRGAAARFWAPRGLASDGAGHLLVADTENRAVRKIDVATGIVSTLACADGLQSDLDDPGRILWFTSPMGLALDGEGHLFVTDWGAYTIRQVVVATGAITTLVGRPGGRGHTDGEGAYAEFYEPWGVVSDGAGNLFVVDSANHTIRKVVSATGAVTTLAGLAGLEGSADGTGDKARFRYPRDLASDGEGNLFVVDKGNHTIRKVVIATGVVTTVVGSPAHAGVAPGPLPAGLNSPRGLAFGPNGELLITDEDAVLVVEF